jgi:hypothetical protein
VTTDFFEMASNKILIMGACFLLEERTYLLASGDFQEV